MLVLTFGPAMRQDWPTVGVQLTYSLIYSLLLAGIRFNSYSVDSRLNVHCRVSMRVFCHNHCRGILPTFLCHPVRY